MGELFPMLSAGLINPLVKKIEVRGLFDEQN